MNRQTMDFSSPRDATKRLDQIGWGIFLIMIGAIWLVPAVPQGIWLIGTGALLLLLNAIRFRSGIHWSRVSTALGVLALTAGLGDLTGIKLPLFAICLIIVGASLVLQSLVSQKA
jgi:hypothetical protein